MGWRDLVQVEQPQEFWVDLPQLGPGYRLAFRPPSVAMVWDAFLDAQQHPPEGVPYPLSGILLCFARCLVDAHPPLDIPATDLILGLATHPQHNEAFGALLQAWVERVPELFRFQQEVEEGKSGGPLASSGQRRQP